RTQGCRKQKNRLDGLHQAGSFVCGTLESLSINKPVNMKPGRTLSQPTTNVCLPGPWRLIT
ncbi:MAG TPA: hypothetical protein PLF60_06705, partial [Bacillota bacterium]|nr:hypothetical protein [Bacillota bacterium]